MKRGADVLLDRWGLPRLSLLKLRTYVVTQCKNLNHNYASTIVTKIMVQISILNTYYEFLATGTFYQYLNLLDCIMRLCQPCSTSSLSQLRTWQRQASVNNVSWDRSTERFLVSLSLSPVIGGMEHDEPLITESYTNKENDDKLRVSLTSLEFCSVRWDVNSN